MNDSTELTDQEVWVLAQAERARSWGAEPTIHAEDFVIEQLVDRGLVQRIARGVGELTTFGEGWAGEMYDLVATRYNGDGGFKRGSAAV